MTVYNQPKPETVVTVGAAKSLIGGEEGTTQEEITSWRTARAKLYYEATAGYPSTQKPSALTTTWGLEVTAPGVPSTPVVQQSAIEDVWSPSTTPQIRTPYTKEGWERSQGGKIPADVVNQILVSSGNVPTTNPQLMPLLPLITTTAGMKSKEVINYGVNLIPYKTTEQMQDVSSINFKQLEQDISGAVTEAKKFYGNIDWTKTRPIGASYVTSTGETKFFEKPQAFEGTGGMFYQNWIVETKPALTNVSTYQQPNLMGGFDTTTKNYYTTQGKIFSLFDEGATAKYRESLFENPKINTPLSQFMFLTTPTGIGANMGLFATATPPKGIFRTIAPIFGAPLITTSQEEAKSYTRETYKTFLVQNVEAGKNRPQDSFGQVGQAFEYSQQFAPMQLAEWGAGSTIFGSALSNLGIPSIAKLGSMMKTSDFLPFSAVGKAGAGLSAYAVSHAEQVQGIFNVVYGGIETFKLGSMYMQGADVREIAGTALTDVGSFSATMYGMKEGIAKHQWFPLNYEDVGYRAPSGKWVSQYSTAYITNPATGNVVAAFGKIPEGWITGVPSKLSAPVATVLEGGFFPQTRMDTAIWEKYILPTRDIDTQTGYFFNKELGIKYWGASPKYEVNWNFGIKNAPEKAYSAFEKTQRELKDEVQAFGGVRQTAIVGGKLPEGKITSDVDLQGLRSTARAREISLLTKNLKEVGFISGIDYNIDISKGGFIFEEPVESHGFTLTFKGYNEKAVEFFDVARSGTPYRWEDVAWNVFGRQRDMPINVRGITTTTAGEQYGREMGSVYSYDPYHMERKAKDTLRGFQMLYERVSSGGGEEQRYLYDVAKAMKVNIGSIPTLGGSTPSFFSPSNLGFTISSEPQEFEFKAFSQPVSIPRETSKPSSSSFFSSSSLLSSKPSSSSVYSGSKSKSSSFFSSSLSSSSSSSSLSSSSSSSSSGSSSISSSSSSSSASRSSSTTEPPPFVPPFGGTMQLTTKKQKKPLLGTQKGKGFIPSPVAIFEGLKGKQRTSGWFSGMELRRIPTQDTYLKTQPVKKGKMKPFKWF